MAMHFQYSYLGNPMDRGVWWVESMELQRVRRDLAAEHTCVHAHLERRLLLIDGF